MIKEAGANYAAIVGQKLREQSSCCGTLHVFLMTNEYRKQDLQYNAGVTLQMEVASNDTTELIKYSMYGIDLL